jgi:hypothetical protein
MMAIVRGPVEGSSFLAVLGTLVLLVFYVGVPVLVISLMIRLYKFLKTSAKEQQLLRMELGKLAEEVKLMRAQRGGGQERGPASEGGS